MLVVHNTNRMVLVHETTMFRFELSMPVVLQRLPAVQTGTSNIEGVLVEIDGPQQHELQHHF